MSGVLILNTIFFIVLLIAMLYKCNTLRNNPPYLVFLLFFIISFFSLNTLYRNILLFSFLISLLLFKKYISFPINKYPITIYYLFIIWCFITLSYSSGLLFGLLMILKLVIPIAFFYIGYNYIFNKDDFEQLLLTSKRPLFILLLLSIAFYPIERFMLDATLIDVYGFSILLCIPLSMHLLIKSRNTIIETILFLVPSFLYGRRTAIGAAIISYSAFLIARFKWKAILQIVCMLFASVILILSVPQLKTRFFGGDKGDISRLSNKELITSTDHLSTSGRAYFWALVIKKFYKGHEIVGSGLGTMKSYIESDSNKNRKAFEILHNDHLHILIETGIVGLLLWLLFYFAVIIQGVYYYIHSEDEIIKVSAMCMVSSVLALSFFMYFTNVLSTIYHIAIVFMFIGMFQKLKEFN